MKKKTDWFLWIFLAVVSGSMGSLLWLLLVKVPQWQTEECSEMCALNGDEGKRFPSYGCLCIDERGTYNPEFSR